MNLSSSIIRFHSSSSNLDQNRILTLLQDTIHKFNLDQKASIKKIGENEIEVSGLNGMPLHNFTLKCEELGGQVDYEKVTIISVD